MAFDKQIISLRGSDKTSFLKSELCAIIIVMPEVMRSVMELNDPDFSGTYNSIKDEFKILCGLLSTLVSNNMFQPRWERDGKGAVDTYKENRGRKRTLKLRNHCELYLYKLEKISTKWSQFKTFLYKPNLHRLNDLYVHNPPMLGNVGFVVELMWENAH